MEPSTIVGGRYRLLSLLGQGGMGQVWRGWDDVLHRPVAVKMLHPGLTGAPDVRQRLQLEAQLSATVRHPGLAAVYDYGVGDPSPYVVMELVEGRALSAILAQDGPLSPAQVEDIIIQVAGTLTAVHAAGVIHRDVKAANLLLTPAGQVVLTDFGIAHALGTAGLTGTGLRIGSPPYMSPEQVSGDSVGPASDVYSLGITAYELLTGARPFTGEPIAVALNHRDQAPPPLPATVPGPLRALVMSMLSKNPGARPSTTQLTDRTDPVRTRFDVAATQPTARQSSDCVLPAAPMPPPPRRKRAATAAVALTLLTALGVVLGTTSVGPSSAPRHDPAVAPPTPGRATRPRPTTPPAPAAQPRRSASPDPAGQQATAVPVDHTTIHPTIRTGTGKQNRHASQQPRRTTPPKKIPKTRHQQPPHPNPPHPKAPHPKAPHPKAPPPKAPPPKAPPPKAPQPKAPQPKH